ncbi:SusC/RagA family TonB-linked outer membrane protein [Parabacteroides sp. FAFU027]|uniref:SusC/RagA family TonB-linked outer membrane protein n=1 Tax=Parabacteroides sp. FAFU027 TaxID=2922715 RepID=UPI001FAF21D8|nr:TonB-dependent receptor [Parabacteroides sp. FAFU027]
MAKLFIFSGNQNRFPLLSYSRQGILLLLFTLSSLSSYAQQVLLKGTIIDEKSKLSVIGATIKIKGQPGGAITDVNGNYSLKVKSLPATLLITIVGYKYQEVDVYDAEPVTIYLNEDFNKLSTVVVVGYGTQKRSDFTGSLSSIPQELKALPVASPDLLLQGAISGIQVTQSTGQPGGSASIQIRGTSSINAGTEPLYVIDGIPVYNGNSSVDAGVTTGSKIDPLTGLNPSDIESIDVLKDASATSIYGSRGANGVIIITTKKAKKNESTITYSGYAGIQQISRQIDLLNGQQWAALKNDALATSGKTALFTQEQIDAFGEGTDWQNEIFRKANTQSHTLSLASGSDKTQLFFSGNYLKQDGIILNTGFEKYSGRLNVNHDVNKVLKFGFLGNGSYSHADVAPAGIVENTLAMVPIVPVKDENGNYTSFSNYGSAVANPVATLYGTTNETNTTRFLANAFGEYQVHKNLTAKVLLGTDIVSNKQNRYLQSSLYESATGGQASIGSLNTISWLNENTLNYNKTLHEKHSLDVLVGNSQQRSITELVTAGATNFLTDETTYNNMGSGSVILTPTSNASQWFLQSFFARVNYGYNEKYFVTLTARADGSSKFSENHKWGTFPSAALAWNVAKEDFLKGNKVIDVLKLRLSAGLTGNQEISPYQSFSRLSSYPYTINNALVYGTAPSTYKISNLTWEKTAQYNLGLDINLLKDRIQLTTDVYYKKTSDLFLEVPVPFSSGLNSVFQNTGSVENKGLELGLKTSNIRKKHFDWSSNVVFTLNRNKVLDLGGADYYIPVDPSNVTQPSQIVKVGEPLGAFYTYITDGLNADGSQKYKLDASGNKVKEIVGSAQPAFLASITNSFKYHNFDLSVFVYSSYGNKIFNRTRANIDLGSGYTNASSDLLNRWTPTNTNTSVHRAEENPSVSISDRYIEDGSYLKIKNITLGYSFPKKLVSKFKVQSLRVYASAQNYFTFTNYKSYDPEVSVNGQSAVNAGIDTGAYPSSKSLIGGLTIQF